MSTFEFNSQGTLLVVTEVEAVGPVKKDNPNLSSGYSFDIFMKSGNVFQARVSPGEAEYARLIQLRDHLITKLDGVK